jgi:alkyl hydroperoxide reductase subunit AhpC
MKSKFIWVAAWLAAQAIVLAEAKVGQPAPDFVGTDINGKTHRLSDYRGKIVVLEAYNLDCPYCANHYKTGAMQELQGAAVSKGIVWLIVNSVHPGHPNYRNAAAARKEFAEQKIKATAWLDDHAGEIGKKYGMQTTPHLFVINQQGVVAYQGAIDDRPESSGNPRTARNYVKAAIEALLAGKAVPVAESKPYGCTVKYAE